MSANKKFLISGVTGGLGLEVLKTILLHVPASEVIISSSRPSMPSELKAQFPEVEFRQVNFDDPLSMETAFQGVSKFFFVSASTPNVEARNRQHKNVVDAAKRAAVDHIYYSSLAFGGYESTSTNGVQASHLWTEKILKEAGVSYTSIREGVYAEAFPLYLGWWPGDSKVFLSADGPTAFASRDELGEATAKLMLRSPPTSFKNNIALLTGPTAVTLADIAVIISEVTGKPLEIEMLSDEEYPKRMAAEDKGKGGKPEAVFEVWRTLLVAFSKGETATVDPLMEELLGRRPKDGLQIVKELLDANPHYTWHQNYAPGRSGDRI